MAKAKPKAKPKPKSTTGTTKAAGGVRAPGELYSPSKAKSLDMHYKISGETMILYSDQFVVQFYPDEFVISFFQSEHPLIFSDADFEKRDSLEARCIARFSLNPHQMQRLFQALQHNVKKWAEIHAVKGEATEAE